MTPTFRIRSPPHGGGAARCWRAVDRGADSAATPSPAARRVASSAPKQTRARGAAAAAKASTVYFSFSSRLVLSQAHTRATCARVAAFAPRRTIRTGSQSVRRRRAAAKGVALASLNAADTGSSTCTAEAAVALYCMPRRVARGTRVAARGTGGARGAAVGQPRGACAPRKLLDRRLHCERGRRYSNFALPIKSARPLLFRRRNLACCFSL